MDHDSTLIVLAHMRNDAVDSAEAKDNDSRIESLYDELSSSFLLLIGNDVLESGPKQGDRWDMCYHGICIASGSIIAVKNRLSITDTNLNRDFLGIHPLMNWVAHVFQSILSASVKSLAFANARTKAKELCYENTPWEKISFLHHATKKNLLVLISQQKSVTNRGSSSANPRNDFSSSRVSSKRLLSRKRPSDPFHDNPITKRIKLSQLSLNEPEDQADSTSCKEDFMCDEEEEEEEKDEENSIEKNGKDGEFKWQTSKEEVLHEGRQLSRIEDSSQQWYSPEIVMFLQRHKRINKLLDVIDENIQGIMKESISKNEFELICKSVSFIRKIMHKQDSAVKIHSSNYDKFLQKSTYQSYVPPNSRASANITKLKSVADLHVHNLEAFNHAVEEMERCRKKMNKSGDKLKNVSALFDGSD